MNGLKIMNELEFQQSFVKQYDNNWLFKTRFDGDLTYLNALHKRVNALADNNAIPDVSNTLWITWTNMKAMLNKDDTDYYSEVMYFSAVMAKKIDEYSTNNMLSGDPTIAKILSELDNLKPCSYELLNY